MTWTRIRLYSYDFQKLHLLLTESYPTDQRIIFQQGNSTSAIYIFHWQCTWGHQLLKLYRFTLQESNLIVIKLETLHRKESSITPRLRSSPVQGSFTSRECCYFDRFFPRCNCWRPTRSLKTQARVCPGTCSSIICTSFQCPFHLALDFVIMPACKPLKLVIPSKNSGSCHSWEDICSDPSE